MGSFKPTSLWLLLSYMTVAFAHLSPGLQSLHLTSIEKGQLKPRDSLGFQKRCVGDCVTCFGAGYRECASSSYICYKPGDAEHGEDTCTSGTTAPTVPTFDFCSKGDCQTCFGTGYQQCPDSSIYCYKPGDSQHGLETCSSSSGSDTSSSTPSSDSASPSPTTSSAPEADDTASSSGASTTSTDFCDNGGFDCKRCFGDTYIPCPDSSQYEHDRYCYDPNNSTSVCPDGSSPVPGSGPGSGSGSGLSSETGSSGSDSTTSPGSTSYTASTPSQPSSVQYSAGSTSTAGSSGSGSGGGSYQPSVTFSGSKTSSAAAGNQTGTFGNPSSSPASATTNGQPRAGGGIFGCAGIAILCFAAVADIML